MMVMTEQPETVPKPPVMLVTGNTYDLVFPGSRTTKGDGYYREFLGLAHGQEKWVDAPPPEDGCFYYWNGSVYIEYCLLHEGDAFMGWLFTPEQRAARTRVTRLLGNDVVLYKPRPYEEVGARQGNQAGPWYTSPGFWALLVLSITWTIVWATVIAGADPNPNDPTVAIGLFCGFIFCWGWYIMAWAICVALYRVNVDYANILKWLLIGLWVANAVKNHVQEHQGRTNPDGSWK